MSVGERFLQKCLNTEVLHDPWPYQIIEDTLSTDVFAKLKKQCAAAGLFAHWHV